MDQKNIEHLPKIEVSFQDDFSNSERNIILTPNYVLKKLKENSLTPSMGDEILLWEKDGDYLCNVGKIVEVSGEILKEYKDKTFQGHKLAEIDGKKVIIKIDDKTFFRQANI